MQPYLFLILFIVNISLKAQNISIPEIDLKDGPLKEVLREQITSRKQEDLTVGYFEVIQMYYNRNATGSKIKEQYSIKIQGFEPKLSAQRFPYFYSYLEGEMLLFYFPGLPFQELNTENKKKLIKKLQPFLNPKEHVVAKDEDNNIIIDDKNFREEFYTLHGGVVIKILANGEYFTENSDYIIFIHLAKAIYYENIFLNSTHQPLFI